VKSLFSASFSAKPLTKTILAVSILGVSALIVMATSAAGQAASARKALGGEMPELARAGELAVGTAVVTYDFADRSKITLMGAVTGRLPQETRRLSMRFWYPATANIGAPRVSYRHEVKSAGKPDFVINTQGVAAENAPPITGQRYPLVILSHGYRGWASHFSNLAENLASKGYVVVAIDHNDAAFDNARSFQMSFGNVMLDRAQDQRQIISRLISEASAPAVSGFLAQIDTDKIGLIGYSMGGFGALATAGAPYDTASKAIKQLPASVQQVMTTTANDVTPKIKALVTLAPWGGAPDNRSWNSEGLAKVTAPVLVISGDHDDVADFDNGVSWIFDHLTGASRHLLIYRQARHNIAGNPVPISADTDFSTLEFFSEPVWRTERINQINQHFITAFLDLNLKGDATKAAFLDLPTPIAGEGQWPSALGEQLGGKYAGDAQPKHWRGFQRRWVLGLEMQRAAKGVTGTTQPKPTQP
jgi:predicted dienelactone hydrolase